MKGRYKEGYAHHQMKKGQFDPKKVDPRELKKVSGSNTSILVIRKLRDRSHLTI